MKKNLILLVMLSLFLVAACRNQCPPLTDLERADIEKQVQEQMKKNLISVSNLNAAEVLSQFSTDNFIAFCYAGPIVLSRSALGDSLETWYGQRKSISIDQLNLKVTVLSADLALVDRTSVNQRVLKNDSTVKYNFIGSYVFKKETSGWKLIHTHESRFN